MGAFLFVAPTSSCSCSFFADDFSKRIADVWGDVKSESFVLYFRSTQSIRTFSNMNKVFCKIADQLRLFITFTISSDTTDLKQNSSFNDMEEARKLLDGCLAEKKIIEKILEKKIVLEKEFVDDVSAFDHPDFVSMHMDNIKKELEVRQDEWFRNDKEQVLNLMKKNLKEREKAERLKEFRKQIQQEAYNIVAQVYR